MNPRLQLTGDKGGSTALYRVGLEESRSTMGASGFFQPYPAVSLQRHPYPDEKVETRLAVLFQQ